MNQTVAPGYGASRPWHLQLPRDVHLGVIAATAIAALAIGSGASFVNGSPPLLIAITAVVAVPLMFWASARAPGLVIALLVSSQILEYLELQTPIGTISAGIVILVVMLLANLPSVVGTVTARGYSYAMVLLAAYVAAHVVQFLHVDAGTAARQMITSSSFVAFTVIGMYIGARRNLLGAAGIGATFGLLVLAAIALASSLGLIPYLAPPSNSREILGITSPFARTYGLGSTNVGLLFALSAPWLASVLRFGPSALTRGLSFTALAMIWVASLLLFQSRSMVLECAFGAALVWMIAERRKGPALLAAGLVGAVALAVGMSLLGSQDESSMVSSQLRLESYATALNYLVSHVQVILVGTDPLAFHLMVNATLTYGDQIPATAPVHNFLIEVLIASGIVGAGALALVIAIPYAAIIRRVFVVDKVDRTTAVIIASATVALIEASVTPAGANSAVLWITLGLLVASAVSSQNRSDSSSRLPLPPVRSV